MAQGEKELCLGNMAYVSGDNKLPTSEKKGRKRGHCSNGALVYFMPQFADL